MKILLTLSIILISAVLFITAIFSSRGSTSGIGLIFLPFVVSIPAFLIIIIQTQKNKKIISLLSALLIFYFGYQIKMIVDVKAKNKIEDEKNRLAQARYYEAQNKFKQIFSNLSTTEINEKINQFMQQPLDREEKLILLANINCSKKILDEYAHDADMGYVLEVARNENTSPEALRYIFYYQNYPFYYYSTLSANPSTPKDVLAALYDQRDKNTLIVPNLSRNPNTPIEIKKLLQY
jgi:hypothetical protein